MAEIKIFMAQKPRNKNKREEKRRQVRYLLRQAPSLDLRLGSTKDNLPTDIAAEYFQYISSNNVSKFGIVKLHCFQLDTKYATADVLPNLSLSYKYITLLMYANLKRRDKIMAALVRCGADPSVHPTVMRRCSIDITSSLLDFPPSYCVWVIRKVYSMLDSAFAGGQVLRRNEVAAIKESRCPTCDCISREEGNNSCLLTWECGHTLCWDCSWEAACRPLSSTTHALRCPVKSCLQRCDGGSDDFFYMISETTVSKGNSFEDDGGVGNCDESPPCVKRKQESYRKWSRLPETVQAYNDHVGGGGIDAPPICPKKPMLQAQPFHVITGQFLGTIQSQRVLELHKASISGDIYRLHALMEAGVDVEGVNDYGQTALFVACMHQQAGSVRYLLWAGGDVGVVDNGGCTLTRAVTCNASASLENKREIINLLRCSCSHDASRERVPAEHLFREMSIRTLPSDVSEEANAVTVTTLIAADRDHLGAGACFVDSCFSEEFLLFVEDKFKKCPVSAPSKQSCSSRSYYCDTDGRVQQEFAAALDRSRSALQWGGRQQQTNSPNRHALRALSSVFPFMRFLSYSDPGGCLPPHEDLSRTDSSRSPPITSTHTFILYLTTCAEGGETTLLSHLAGRGGRGEDGLEEEQRVLARVRPVRGRLLLFPHRCPHEGAPVNNVPKTLLRGEAF